MNRPALRHALRSIFGWLLVLITAAYLAASIVTGAPITTTCIYGLVFGIYAALVFGFRYQTAVNDQARAVERQAHDARAAELRAERQALLEQIDRAVQAGARCPEGCPGCAADQRESDRSMAAFLRERAARHGHAPTDQDRRDALAELNDRLHPGYVSDAERDAEIAELADR